MGSYSSWKNMFLVLFSWAMTNPCMSLSNIWIYVNFIEYNMLLDSF